MMTQAEVARLIWAVMEAAGVTRVEVPMDRLAVDHAGLLSWHDDPMRDHRVFIRRDPAAVIDGEEVPTATREITR